MDYRGALLRRWWVLVVVGLIGALLGAFLQTGPSKGGSNARWSTHALVGVAPTTGTGTRPLPGSSSPIGPTEILFYAHEASVIGSAARSAGLHETLSRLEAAVTVSGEPAKGGQAGVVKISAIANTPGQSAAFTNDFALQLGNYLTTVVATGQQAALQQAQQKVAALQKTISGSAKVSSNLIAQLNAALAQVQQLSAPPQTGYSVLQPAAASSAVRVQGKSSSVLRLSPVTAGVAGFIIGALLAAALVLLIEMFDNRLHNSRRAEEAFGYRVIAEIPSAASASRSKKKGQSEPSVTHSDEAYRRLCMSLSLEIPQNDLTSGNGDRRVVQAEHEDDGKDGVPSPTGIRPGTRDRQLVLIASPGTETTRASVVKDLAATFAHAGQRVLVMSTVDLPSTVDGASSVGAFTDLTLDELSAHLQPTQLENVAVLPFSHLIGGAGQLVTRAPAVLNASRNLADVVIIEAPPMLAFHDAEALACMSDLVLLVGECGETTIEQAGRAGEQMRRIDAPVLGVVLTEVVKSPSAVRHADRSQISGMDRARFSEDPFRVPSSAFQAEV